MADITVINNIVRQHLAGKLDTVNLELPYFKDGVWIVNILFGKVYLGFIMIDDRTENVLRVSDRIHHLMDKR